MACRWSGRVALVTGASAGIGKQVARQLTQLGMTVIGCARNIEQIKILGEELNQPDVTGALHAIRCDVSNEDEILALFTEIKKKYGGVDVCINNAGLARIDCCLLDGETDKWRELIDVNILGLCICTREAIKSMRERNIDDGHVIHLNRIFIKGKLTSKANFDEDPARIETSGFLILYISITGYFCGLSGHRLASSQFHFYAATKFAVTALTEGLRRELQEIKSHIRISSISPGMVETEFAYRAGGKDYGDKAYSQYKTLEANDIADAVMYVLQAPPHVQIHDILIRGTEQKS